MHEYYFKIKKGDIEFECSTSDKVTFEEKLSDWINGIVQGKPIEEPEQTLQQEEHQEKTENKPQRSDFIDVKNLVSINEISKPKFDSTLSLNNENEELGHPLDFEQALEESMQNPKTEVVEKSESLDDFAAYLNAHNPQNDIDKLIIAAKYILNVENQECFSLKQINAKLVPCTGSPINHAMIEDAMNQNWVRILPDLTGTAEYTEYTLTEDGEGYFVD